MANVPSPPPPHLPLARRRAAWLLVFTLALILYASFFPFRFDGARFSFDWQGGLAALLPWGPTARADRAANFLSYLPFGALVAYLAPVRSRALIAWLAGVSVSAALSVSVEVLQHFTPSRVPNLADAAMNVAGGAVGAIVGALLRTRSAPLRALTLRHARPEPIALVLLALWIAAHAVPFMPRLNQGHAWLGMLPLRNLEWNAAAIAVFAASYVLLGVAVRRLVVTANAMRDFILLAVASLALRVLFLGQWLTLDECVGLGIAVPVVLVLGELERARAARIALAIVVTSLAIEFLLRPEGAWSEAVIFLSRAYLIVGALWLAAGAGFSLLGATVLVGAGVALLAGPTAGLLAVVAGFLVHAGRVLHHAPAAEVTRR